jgi:hypothetical protein
VFFGSKDAFFDSKDACVCVCVCWGARGRTTRAIGLNGSNWVVLTLELMVIFWGGMVRIRVREWEWDWELD